MKNITINRLTLENFKCHSRLNLVFGGGNASIYGDNATGKTSIYDALTWLLFGKDSAGNGEKNMDIKPLDGSGQVKDHQAITSVEAELLVDGVGITLARTYREIWTTRRGSSEAAYEGNTSNYYVDGVPQKKNAFDAKIKELVPEDVFRLLTSVSYFASDMKWQDRRATLFDIAGTLSDKEIMASNSQFQPLLDSLGKLTLPEYKAKLLSQRKGLIGIRDDTPTRISECQKTLEGLQGLDFQAAKEQEKQLTRQQEEISMALIALENNAALADLRLKLREADLERDTLESQNRAYRDKQSVNIPNSRSMETVLRSEQNRLESLRLLITNVQGEIEHYRKEVAATRDEWIAVNGEAFAGGVCPTCKQTLPFEQLQKATEAFETNKKQRLQKIMDNGNRLKQSCEESEKRLADLMEEAAEREKHIQELSAQLDAAKSTTVVISDMPDYARQLQTVQERIGSLQASISSLMADSAQEKDATRRKLEAVNDQLRQARSIVAKESVQFWTAQRIEELRNDARNAAEALESIDKMLFLMEEFQRFKARFVEDGINSLFRMATFRLFREQANGGLEERCDVVYNGVPYMGLNTGSKINVGIDIINTLSRHYGVTVPLFIDNAEAVTKLLDCNAQVIRLVVSEMDKELRVV